MSAGRPSLTPVFIGFLSIGAFVAVMYFSLQSLPAKQNANTNSVSNTNQVACTREAKICPDGSSVGREGPDCEFAACSNTNSTTDVTAGWKKYDNRNYFFSVLHPESWKITEQAVERDAFNYYGVNFCPTEDASGCYQINIYRSLKDLPDGSKYSSLADWIKAQENTSLKYPETQFLGFNAYEGVWGSAVETYSFYFEHNDHIFNIDLNWKYPEQRVINSSTNRAEFNEAELAFLDSFTFTDKTGWKSYTDSSLAYSIQYPPTWTQTVEADTVLIVPPATVAVNYAEGSTRLIIQKADSISSDLVTSSTSVMVNGRSATQQTEGGLGVYTATYFPLDQGFIEIVYDKDVTQAEFPQILASFTFTQ